MSIDEIVKMSPPLALAVAINAVLFALKRVPNFPVWSLPFVAMLIGMVTYPAIAETAAVSFHVKYPPIFNMVIGLCIGGFAVGLHQAVKQSFIKDGRDV